MFTIAIPIDGFRKIELEQKYIFRIALDVLFTSQEYEVLPKLISYFKSEYNMESESYEEVKFDLDDFIIDFPDGKIINLLRLNIIANETIQVILPIYEELGIEIDNFKTEFTKYMDQKIDNYMKKN